MHLQMLDECHGAPAQVYVDEMCLFQNHPPQNLVVLGGVIFFGLKCRKFDSGTQVFCWTFFRHKHTYSNTPHPQKSICTHHRHKNRFQNFQKMAILAPKRCSNTAAKSVVFARLFKRKKFPWNMQHVFILPFHNVLTSIQVLEVLGAWWKHLYSFRTTLNIWAVCSNLPK